MLNRFLTTDPEFAERAQRFACEEVTRDAEAALDGDTRHLAILAALVARRAKKSTAKCCRWRSTPGFRQSL